jgi:hypothetical protein
LKGHGFSRAADKAEKLAALATEGKLEKRPAYDYESASTYDALFMID